MNTPHTAPAGPPPLRNEPLQMGLDLMEQGFTLMDSELRLVAWNKAFLRLLDFPEHMAWQGAPLESFLRFNAERGEYGAGDVNAQVAQRLSAARAFQTHDIERTRPDGSVLRIHGVPVPGHGFVTLYSDVTRQHQSDSLIRQQKAELENRVADRTLELLGANDQLRDALRLNEQIAHSLERSEAQMRLITDSIPALVAYFDSGLVYRYINRGYRDWFGIDPFHPERVSAREFLGHDTYTHIKPNIKQALRGEPVTFEYEVSTQGGVKRIARTSLIPEVTDGGHVVGCFELTFDITQERRAHDMLVQAQKMEALGQLTSGLSHDFNNILTIILGNLTALSEQPDVRHHVEEFIAPAMEAARRGSDLIRGLLSFSRQQPMQTHLVDVDASVRSMDKLVRHTLPETLHLHFELSGAGAHCELDANQFHNAMLNLILNARDATEGRGYIRVHTSLHLLEADAADLSLRPGRYARVAVTDNGCGMDALTRLRVFEPFFTTKGVGKGSGLGMSMVYGFARQSGGTVLIDSEPGKGTTVALWLPVHSPADGDTAPATSGEAAAGADAFDVLPTQGLALLVEDDASVRKVVRRHLLDLGYAVLEAENGAEALAILAQTPGLQAVVSDFVMPGGVDGREVTTYARQVRRVPRVVLMSGYPPQAGQAADVPLIQKPFTREQLQAVLSCADSDAC